jgi:hypothetical protein
MEAQRFNEAIPLPEQQLLREDCIQLRQLVRVAACSVLRVHQRLKTAPASSCACARVSESYPRALAW